MLIEICDYQQAWTTLYQRAAEEIRAAVGTTAERIDHIGSTAVPGLASKPVIDMQITVRYLRDVETLIPAMETLGYVYRMNADNDRPPPWEDSSKSE